MTVNVALYFIGGLFLGVILKHLYLCFRDDLAFSRELDRQQARQDELLKTMLVVGAVLVVYGVADQLAQQNGWIPRRAGLSPARKRNDQDQPTKKEEI